MATGGCDRSVDSRVVCCVCLEPYKGRQPKLLPCFHTFCLPCLSQLAHKHSQPQGGDVDGCAKDEGDQKTGAPFATITCPTCRNVIPVPPGGVKDFQSNFYVCDKPDTSVTPTTSSGTKPVSVSEITDQEEEMREKVRSQVKVLEAVLSRMAEEEEEITGQKRTLDHDIQTRYAAGLRHLADARDQSLIILRDAAQGAQDKLEAERSLAETKLQSLSQLTTGEGSRLQGEMLSEAALRHFHQVSQKKGRQNYFTYITTEASSRAMADTCQQFMGTVGSFGQTAGDTTPPAITATAEIKSRDEDLRQTSNANSAEILKLHHELSALQTQNSKLRHDLTSVLTESTQLAKDVGALQKDANSTKADTYAKLDKDFKVLQKGVDDLRQTMISLQAETSRLAADNTQKLTTVETETQKIITDVERLLKDVGDLHKSMGCVQADNTKLSAEVSTVQTHVDNLQQEVATAKIDINKLNTDVGTVQTDVAKLQQDVASTQTDNTKLNALVGTVQQDLTKLEKAQAQGDDSALRKDLQTSQGDIKTLQQTVQAVQDSLSKSSHTVAFHALLQQDLKTNKERVRLTFSDVITNVGGGYDPQTGIFTAPVSGTYMFMATARPIVTKDSKTRFVIIEGERPLSSKRLCWSDASGHNSATGHAVVELAASQRVWIGSGAAEECTFYENGWTCFSGALMQAKLQ